MTDEQVEEMSRRWGLSYTYDTEMKNFFESLEIRTQQELETALGWAVAAFVDTNEQDQRSYALAYESLMNCARRVE